MRFLSPARSRPLFIFFALSLLVPLTPQLATGQTSPNSTNLTWTLAREAGTAPLRFSTCYVHSAEVGQNNVSF